MGTINQDETTSLLSRSTKVDCRTQCDENNSEFFDESLVPSSPPISIFSLVPNLIWIEISLFSNVFLSGFDTTVTASTYETIGGEFSAADRASWITSSYLITFTSFQPLYGSFSDILGRRWCVLAATSIFGLGCLGCAISPNILILDIMRAITGVGGGGLISLSTIVNSDIIAPKQRGIFQAFQNLLLGLGAICGASFGGLISDYIGWRWCFILQVPIAFLAIFIGYLYIENQPEFHQDDFHSVNLTAKIDFKGSILLVSSLVLQLLVLNFGGNEYSWTDPRLTALMGLSLIVSIWFLKTEGETKASPIIPLELLNGAFSYILLGIGVLAGISNYAYLFIAPLLFQVVIDDSAAAAGLRLALPSLFTPIGGLSTGYFMSKYNCLPHLVRTGSLTMLLGNALVLLIHGKTPSYLISLYLAFINLGQGIIFPSSLFSFIYAFPKDRQASSTSTAYALRSIGSVWGIAVSSAIVQYTLRSKLFSELARLNYISKEEISKITTGVIKDIGYIKLLPAEIQKPVVGVYEVALKRAQLLPIICCFLSLILCFLRDIFKPKTQTGFR
ncbi:hypothetical protein PACTADRAFT_85762 [Pachysolen tannophilus NRRL Y-2460]|uniref:Major facilitator superfamily (MFS) profile domain-containing protein n=1 Tax=Pachysolen tannophilus NRRL Y-2460 TaxID=669874 RepID=A0A1E4TVG4_PACTA|nr:hypothetical protein PACTADRAFT_85762 [Pachysolen tannophilus NRRL Y-2460]